MRALSLTQPWATLVVTGQKRIETRGWSTDYRGQVIIHAAMKFPPDARAACQVGPFRSALGVAGDRLPLGALIGAVDLVDVERTTRLRREPYVVLPGHRWDITPTELAFGDYSDGRKGFLLANAVAFDQPIPYRGQLGLWRLPDDVLDRVQAQLSKEQVCR